MMFIVYEKPLTEYLQIQEEGSFGTRYGSGGFVAYAADKGPNCWVAKELLYFVVPSR